jgi:hypothetical protein
MSRYYLSMLDDSDSEDDWEEVDVPDQHIEIIINARPKHEKLVFFSPLYKV